MRHFSLLLALLLLPLVPQNGSAQWLDPEKQQQQQQQQKQQMQPQPDPDAPQPIYTELSTHWDHVGSFNSGFKRLAAVAVCPTKRPGAGQLLAIDSSGQVSEWRYDEGNWSQLGEFSIGEEIISAVAGAPHLDFQWRVYVAAKSGKIFELNRGPIAWTTDEVIQLKAPILNLLASDPGNGGISQLMVIDADSSVTNLWLTEEDQWVARSVPDIPGGATEVTFNYQRTGLEAVISGAAGGIYHYTQDSTGNWIGTLWATMPAGALDMGASADPSMHDIAIFYSGVDGVFRYLRYDFKTDERAQVPVAGGTIFIVGKGRQRRFNEFFGLNGDQFCIFEFEYGDQSWHREPITRFTSPMVSIDFGPGRGENLFQMYAATADGQIHELYRGAVVRDEEGEPLPSGPEEW